MIIALMVIGSAFLIQSFAAEDVAVYDPKKPALGQLKKINGTVNRKSQNYKTTHNNHRRKTGTDIEHDQLVKDIKTRKAAFKAAIRQSPDEVVALAMPDSVKNTLPEEVKAEIEQVTTVKGKWINSHADPLPNKGLSEIPIMQIQTPDYRRTSVFGKEVPSISSGTEVSAPGVLVDGDLAVASKTSQTTNKTSFLDKLLGRQKVEAAEVSTTNKFCYNGVILLDDCFSSANQEDLESTYNTPTLDSNGGMRILVVPIIAKGTTKPTLLSTTNQRPTASDINTMLTSGTLSALNEFKKMSYGKLNPTFKVIDWIETTNNPVFDCSETDSAGDWLNYLRKPLIEQIEAGKIKPGDYTNILYIGDDVNCKEGTSPNFGGVSSKGKDKGVIGESALYLSAVADGADSKGNRFVYPSNGNINDTAMHEFGHIMNLEHAHSACADTEICGDPEYGDPYDSMGVNPINSRHYNAFYKWEIGWLNDSNFTYVKEPGTYTINSLSSQEDNVKALRIPVEFKDGKVFKALYVEYRPAGGDALDSLKPVYPNPSDTNIKPGVLVRETVYSQPFGLRVPNAYSTNLLLTASKMQVFQPDFITVDGKLAYDTTKSIRTAILPFSDSWYSTKDRTNKYQQAAMLDGESYIYTDPNNTNNRFCISVKNTSSTQAEIIYTGGCSKSNPTATATPIDTLGTKDLNGSLKTTTSDPPATPLSSLVATNCIETSKHLLMVEDGDRVLIYKLDDQNKLIDQKADYVLGANAITTSDGKPAPTFLDSKIFSDRVNREVVGAQVIRKVSGQNLRLSCDSKNHQLFVFAAATNRTTGAENVGIKVFDLSGALSNGMPASRVLGQPSLTSFTTAYNTITDKSFGNVISIQADPARNLLFVSDNQYQRILVFDTSAGLTDNQSAKYVIGAADFTTKGTAYSFTNMTLDSGLDSGVNGRLFVAVSRVSQNEVSILTYNLNNLTNNMQPTVKLPMSRVGNLLFNEKTKKLLTTYELVRGVQDSALLVYDASKDKFSNTSKPITNITLKNNGTIPLGLSYDEINGILYHNSIQVTAGSGELGRYLSMYRIPNLLSDWDTASTRR